MTRIDPTQLRSQAEALRAEALGRIAQDAAVEWTALKDRLCHALARNPRPASPVMPKG